MGSPLIEGRNGALYTDDYQLTMAQSYLREGMDEEATFSLFFRELPDHRDYLLACGVEDVLDFLGAMRFDDEDIAYLRSREVFSEDFLGWLSDFEFGGEVRAVAEGTPVFAEEPLVEVTAPIAVAQIVETIVLNQVHFQSILATKASRVAEAAGEAAVLDFGARRIHGTDAGLKACRAYHIGGLAGTSLVLAGELYGVPVSGTMAHSYIQAHDDEYEAFRQFTKTFPETILLVDTYETVTGVRRVVELAEELGEDFAVRGIRLDSGDLGELARRSREILDEAGLEDVEIIASGGLDEYAIAGLREDGAPIDGFGVGTNLATSEDAPKLDMAYKLVEYDGRGRMKLSQGKRTLPGAKQVFRRHDDGGRAVGDRLARRGAEPGDDTPLLEVVMEEGVRTSPREDLDAARERAASMRAALPDDIRSIEGAEAAYPVELDEELERYHREVRERIEARF
jgi:nicotinate phosphoribosyltransferase